MNWWLIFIPVVSALAGWLMNVIVAQFFFYPVRPKKLLVFTFQGIIPKHKSQLTRNIAAVIKDKLTSSEYVEDHLTNAGSFEKIRPLVESHIDIFLREKLKAQMPVISTFIGEKTILQLKEIFLKELNELFPLVMKNYVNVINQEFLGEKMEYEILKFSEDQIDLILKQNFSLIFKSFRTYGAFSGFIIGLIQAALIMIVFLTGK